MSLEPSQSLRQMEAHSREDLGAALSAEVSGANSDEETLSTLRSRVAGFLVLLCTSALVGWLGYEAFFAVSDSWVAPLHISPEQDQVLQARLRLSEEVAKRARLVVEKERNDDAIAGALGALERLRELRARTEDVLTQTSSFARRQASVSGVNASSISAQLGSLRALKASIESDLVAARRDHAHGILGAPELAARERILVQTSQSLAELERLARETEASRVQINARAQSLAAMQAGAHEKAVWVSEALALHQEQTRLDLEMVKLEGEVRYMRLQNGTITDDLATMDRLLASFSQRPLYRAVNAAVDVAFVPYAELSNIRTSQSILKCVGGFLFCREVGEVREIIGGEVVTEGPWGDRARGRYIVMDLHSPEARESSTLRVRSR